MSHQFVFVYTFYFVDLHDTLDDKGLRNDEWLKKKKSGENSHNEKEEEGGRELVMHSKFDSEGKGDGNGHLLSFASFLSLCTNRSSRFFFLSF